MSKHVLKVRVLIGKKNIRKIHQENKRNTTISIMEYAIGQDGKGHIVIDYALLDYFAKVNEQIIRITNGRPDLYPANQVYELRKLLMGDLKQLRKKVLADKINKPILFVGAALLIIFSILVFIKKMRFHSIRLTNEKPPLRPLKSQS